MSAHPHRRVSEPLIDLSVSRRCHVVGVGGPGMSPIAKLLAARGHVVSGSDMRDTVVTQQLRQLGVAVTIGHDAHLVDDVDVVTYSTAIPQSNVELVAARERDIPVRHRSGMLASLCATSRAIGVAGTHGKTTTTALLAVMLEAGGVDPSVIVGAEIPGHGVGARAGSSDVLVLEADESDGTLDVLALHSVIVTNVDVDHLDYFGTFENVQQCFVDVALRATGIVVLNSDDAGTRPVREAMAGRSELVTFGVNEGAMVRIQQSESIPQGLAIRFVIDGESYECLLPLRGEHNAMNCAAALAMATAFGVDARVACSAAQTFTGVARRFTERGTFAGALLVDDYAHLPAEIEAAVAAARTHPSLTGRVVAVFQPNRFHRIAAMAHTYADCFQGADHVIITDVYASGTERIEGVTGEMVSDAIVQAHPRASISYAPTRHDIVRELRSMLHEGDVCISMGCGDIESLPDEVMGTTA